MLARKQQIYSYYSLSYDLYCIYWTCSPSSHIFFYIIFKPSDMAYPSTASTVHLSSKIKLSLVGACISTVITIGELFCHNTFIFSFLSSTFWHYMHQKKQTQKEKWIVENTRHPSLLKPLAQDVKIKIWTIRLVQQDSNCPWPDLHNSGENALDAVKAPSAGQSWVLFIPMKI